MPSYPQLVVVPGYPVYYDPRANSNYFFYDGLYWVYQEDNWYASEWYNGPWQLTDPYDVPQFVLRVPVRYYRQPPVYFQGWRADRAPRWGEHWGNDWQDHHKGWNHWDHNPTPRAAPLPVYQRQYSGERYPQAEEQQHSIREEHYRYQPHEGVTREHFQQRDNAHADDRKQEQSQPQSSVQQQHSQPNQQAQQVSPAVQQPVEA